MFPIFKVHHVIDNKISKIYAFIGNEKISEEESFATINKRLNIFTSDEFSYIQNKGIIIQYINKLIHPDDTILRIKEKLFYEIDELDISINEIYLFHLINKLLNIDNILNEFQNNSLHDQDVINKLKLFLMNFIKSQLDMSILDEMLYTFNPSENTIYEILQGLNIDWENPLLLAKSLGNYINTKNNYPYISNPFLIKQDEYLSREGQNIISTQNNNCLFKFFPILQNNIYLCTAQNVLEYSRKKSIDDNYILKLYFPILFKKDNIQNLDDLLSKKGNLKDNDKSKLKKYYKSYNKRVDLLYDIYGTTEGLLDNKKSGIEFIHFQIKSIHKIKMPLEILFKTMNSTENIPLIKYNPGKSHENIFRLYTNGHVSTTGAKIPDLYVKNNLRKKKIIDISNILSKNKSVGFFIYSVFHDHKYEILCEIHENGNVDIKCEISNLLSVDNIKQLIINSVNDNILINVNNFLKQKGYNYVTFKDFKQSNIFINNIHYKFSVPNSKKINIKNIIGCITPLFNVNSSMNSDGIINLTYKRVSSFHLMNSILSFITIQKQNAESFENIIKLLMNNFEKDISTEMKAREYLQQWSQEIKIKTETYGNKNRIIDSNPGFETIIFNEIFPETTYLSMVMQNINNINYIQLLEIYFHSITVLLKKIELNEELSEKIKNLCNKTSKKIKHIEEQKDVDIQEEISKTDPIIFERDEIDSMDELSDYSDRDDDDEIDFGELMEKEEKNTELPQEDIVSSLKISEKLKSIDTDDDLESEEDEEELDLTLDDPISKLILDEKQYISPVDTKIKRTSPEELDPISDDEDDEEDDEEDDDEDVEAEVDADVDADVEADEEEDVEADEEEDVVEDEDVSTKIKQTPIEEQTL